jgi:transposase
LGNALNDIAEYEASKLFAEVAFGIALDNNLLDLTNPIDTTTLSVHGAYEIEDDPKDIEVTYEFSQDHRPDLKQVVLSLVVKVRVRFLYGWTLWMGTVQIKCLSTRLYRT